jgi:hypothetical protein
VLPPVVVSAYVLCSLSERRKNGENVARKSNKKKSNYNNDL